MTPREPLALSRSFARDTRARLGAMRKSGQWLAGEIGRSQNYVAKRLRDEACFTLDDVELITAALTPGPSFGGLDLPDDLADSFLDHLGLTEGSAVDSEGSESHQ